MYDDVPGVDQFFGADFWKMHESDDRFFVKFYSLSCNHCHVRRFFPDISIFSFHFSFYDVVSVPRRVLPYKQRKTVRMFFKLMKLWQQMGTGPSTYVEETSRRDARER